VSLRNRLERLEGAKRERDVGLLRAFWRSLDVEECALLAAYGQAERTGTEPPPGARDLVEARRRRSPETEEALRRAIGWQEGMADEEIDARMSRLMDEVDPFAGRFEAVRRRYEALTGSRS
jgi:hypothetical protein